MLDLLLLPVLLCYPLVSSAGSDDAPDGEGDNPQLFLETTQAISERGSVPRQNGLDASLAGDLWRHLMGHFGSLGPFPGKPLLAVLGLLDDSRGPDTVCGRVSQKNGRSWASKK